MYGCVHIKNMRACVCVCVCLFDDVCICILSVNNEKIASNIIRFRGYIYINVRMRRHIYECSRHNIRNNKQYLYIFMILFTTQIIYILCST